MQAVSAADRDAYQIYTPTLASSNSQKKASLSLPVELDSIVN
jgi:hypothetical protein